MRIKPAETMALCIDYQERLMPVIRKNEELIERSAILIKGLKLLNIPIIVSRQYPKGLGDTVVALRELTKGMPVLDKTEFSCYLNPNIRDAIQEEKKKKIILMGVESHICVLQTLIDLQAESYQCILVADCIGSRKKHDHKLALRRAEYEGAIITSYEALLFELTNNSKDAAFKDISALLK